MRKALSLVLGILMIIGGVYCLATPGITFMTLGYVLGFCIVFDGIGRIINWFQIHREADISGWFLASAILSLAVGILLVGSEVLQLAVNVFIVYLAIIWMIAIGAMRIVHAAKIKKARNLLKNYRGDTLFGRNWWVALVFGILLILCGVVGLFVPSAVARTIGILIGVSIIISGANMIHFGLSSWMIL